MNRLISVCTISLSLIMLTVAIGFNLWLYRAEPTAQVDPNDNAFQYSLVDRTNQIWDWAEQTCPKDLSHAHCLMSYLTDHWVPNWAEGYNLPYYYGHVPQIVIVGSYRLLIAVSHQSSAISLFQYYHWTIYLLLCFFPLSIFLSLRILKLPWLTAGIGALLATHISTDGLYGLDPPSFLWRGWGLSSQLFAMIWMPLALAYSIRWLTNSDAIRKQFFEELKICFRRILRKNHGANLHLAKGKYLEDSDMSNQASSKNLFHDRKLFDFFCAVICITATTMGHMGLGLMLFLSLPVISLTKPILTFFHQGSFKTIWEEIKEGVIKTLLLALPPLVLLSYWIIPTVLDSAYHNTSFWDPIWKFNSYGAKEVLVNLWNGSLFDWGRLPIYTLLVFVGLFYCFYNANEQKTISSGQNSLSHAHCPMSEYLTPLPFLFLFFLLLYFGSTTWGGILNLIPGMSDFHQHRFIVGVHLIGLFLAPIGFLWIIEQCVQLVRFKIYDLGFTNKSILKSYFVHPTSISLWTIIFTIAVSTILIPPIFKQTLSYGRHNETLIVQANTNFANQKNDADLLITTLKELMQKNPGRVFAGRGGSWGKTFRVAETPYFMYLSTYGIPTVLWLPQTWSNNSDTEQYFSEENQSHYSLYNIRYVVTPARNASSIADAGGPVAQQPQSFWTLIKQTDHWKLYEVKSSARSPRVEAGHQSSDSKLEKKLSESSNLKAESSSYITAGVSPSVVFSDKLSFANVVRLWIQSSYPEKTIFPQLILTGKNLASQGQALGSYSQLPHFWMLDEATYQTPARNASSIADAGGPDGKSHSLFAEPPVYMTPWEYPSAFQTVPSTSESKKISNFKFQISNVITILSQSSDTDMVFKATVQIATPSSTLQPLPSTPTPNAPSSSIPCPTCVVVLKQTYHPNWKATIRKISPSSSTQPPLSPSPYLPIQTINVFPSYVAVRLEQPGTYEVTFSYQPSKIKMFLLGIGILLGIGMLIKISVLPIHRQ